MKRRQNVPIRRRTENIAARYHNPPDRPARRLHPRLVLATVLLATLVGACGGGRDHDSAVPAPPGSRLPWLASAGDGSAVLSWVEPTAAGHRLVYAVRGDDAWTAPRVVAEGRDWFVNWADVPSVVPLSETLWAAHWLVKQPGGMYAYDVALALSRDGGVSWDPPRRPHHDTSPTEHGFVSLWPARRPNGSPAVGMVWLDGRHTLLDPSRGQAHDPRTSLRSAVVDEHGERLSSAIVDDRVCDCCPTSVALDRSGPVVAYRDRSAADVRDIAAARFAGGAWTSLGRVAEDAWTISGCPVNGPAIAARGDDLAVAWYTEGDDRRRVRLARGRAAGGWEAALDLATGTPLGRVALTWLEGDELAVAWLDDIGDGQAALRLARTDARRSGAPLQVATVDSARPSGFPRLIRHGAGLLLAWTRWRDGTPQVVTRRLPLSALPPLEP